MAPPPSRGPPPPPKKSASLVHIYIPSDVNNGGSNDPTLGSTPCIHWAVAPIVALLLPPGGRPGGASLSYTLYRYAASSTHSVWVGRPV